MKKAEKKIEKQDARERNAVEGKFGEGKRKYGLSRIYARLKETAECVNCHAVFGDEPGAQAQASFHPLFQLAVWRRKRGSFIQLLKK